MLACAGHQQGGFHCRMINCRHANERIGLQMYIIYTYIYISIHMEVPDLLKDVMFNTIPDSTLGGYTQL